MMHIDAAGSLAVAQQTEDRTVWPAARDLFGVPVSPTTYDEAVRTIMRAARRGEAAVVSCYSAHALVTASTDRELRRKVRHFQMITPDGQPLRWALNRLYGTALEQRVYGPELMLRLCQQAARQGVAIYLYGGRPEVVRKLAERLAARCPALKVAGYESPPFRPLTEAEDAAAVQRIRSSGARLVFIGLGSPKQDHFAYAHRDCFQAVQVCVGAAFDFHAGTLRQAPRWMQDRGLEWGFRLACEPGRLWRRYLVTNSRFLLQWAAAEGRRAFGPKRRTAGRSRRARDGTRERAARPRPNIRTDRIGAAPTGDSRTRPSAETPQEVERWSSEGKDAP